MHEWLNMESIMCPLQYTATRTFISNIVVHPIYFRRIYGGEFCIDYVLHYVFSYVIKTIYKLETLIRI